MTPSHHWPSYPMITRTPLVAGDLPMRTLVSLGDDQQNLYQCLIFHEKRLTKCHETIASCVLYPYTPYP